MKFLFVLVLFCVSLSWGAWAQCQDVCDPSSCSGSTCSECVPGYKVSGGSCVAICDGYFTCTQDSTYLSCLSSSLIDACTQHYNDDCYYQDYSDDYCFYYWDMGDCELGLPASCQADIADAGPDIVDRDGVNVCRIGESGSNSIGSTIVTGTDFFFPGYYCDCASGWIGVDCDINMDDAQFRKDQEAALDRPAESTSSVSPAIFVVPIVILVLLCACFCYRRNKQQQQFQHAVRGRQQQQNSVQAVPMQHTYNKPPQPVQPVMASAPVYVAQPMTTNTVYCPTCGAVMTPGMPICGACGNNINGGVGLAPPVYENHQYAYDNSAPPAFVAKEI